VTIASKNLSPKLFGARDNPCQVWCMGRQRGLRLYDAQSYEACPMSTALRSSAILRKDADKVYYSDNGIVRTLDQPLYLIRIKGKTTHCLNRTACARSPLTRRNTALSLRSSAGTMTKCCTLSNHQIWSDRVSSHIFRKRHQTSIMRSLIWIQRLMTLVTGQLLALGPYKDLTPC
jgi:hypothetical protein